LTTDQTIVYQLNINEILTYYQLVGDEMRITLVRMLCLVGCLLSASVLHAQEKLLFAIDVIRHGDRSPITSVPALQQHWPTGWGQLSALGQQQEYALGVKLRTRYVYQSHLLPLQYQANTMYVRSTDILRTKMSARSLLSGLYPDAYRLVPINVVSVNQDALLLSDHAANHFDELSKRYIESSPAWAEKTAALQPKFANWSRVTGMQITNLRQLKAVGDALYVEQVNHLPLPPGLSKEDANQIIQAGWWVMLSEFKNKTIGRAIGGKLLKTIMADLQAATKQQGHLKYILFSAHDSTILGQLSALGAPLEVVPPYASDLNFSLFDQGHHHYVVKVTFNDQPVQIPACGGSTCQLGMLVKMAQSV
jgi:lysosomal acid phosphatase